MISSLIISLRKAADGSPVKVWDGGHFAAVVSGEHEMIHFASPPLPSQTFMPSPRSPVIGSFNAV